MEKLFERKSCLKICDQWNNLQSFQGHCPWTPQGEFIVSHMKCQLQGANMLTHIGLWAMAIKLNPSWKMEVSKSTWINPWKGQSQKRNFLYKYFLYNYKNACNLGKLYLLPKIHKRLFNVPGRPVISNCGTPTEKASEFLDHHLKPVWFRYIDDIFSSALMAKNTLNYS